MADRTLGVLAARMVVLRERLRKLSVCEGEVEIGTPEKEFWRAQVLVAREQVADAAKGAAAAWFGTEVRDG